MLLWCPPMPLWGLYQAAMVSLLYPYGAPNITTMVPLYGDPIMCLTVPYYNPLWCPYYASYCTHAMPLWYPNYVPYDVTTMYPMVPLLHLHDAPTMTPIVPLPCPLPWCPYHAPYSRW